MANLDTENKRRSAIPLVPFTIPPIADGAITAPDRAQAASIYSGISYAATIYILACDAGVYVLTGKDISLLKSGIMAATPGSYILTGKDASLLKGSVVVAASGTYVLTGKAASFLRNYVVSCGAGAYIITGQVATLIYTPIGAAIYTLTADGGVYVLTGKPVNLKYIPVVILSKGATSAASIALSEGTPSVVSMNFVQGGTAGNYIILEEG